MSTSLSAFQGTDELGLRLDCRHYLGDRPCAAGVPGACPADCTQYAAQGTRILIIKLGALGDVVRTAAILPGLKERWPESQITWVSRPAGVRILANQPLIERRVVLDAEATCHLLHERFDVCLSLDKEPGPAGLAMRVIARDRRGIGLSPHGTPFPLNEECAEYFELGLDDELKFRANTKTYPQLIYEALGLTWRRQRYRLYPGEAEQARAAALWHGWGVCDADVMVGLNTGAGRVFANKNWSGVQFAELSRRLTARPGWRVAWLGGPDEIELNARLAREVPGTIDTGGQHSELEFAALIERCQVVVTGDTLALHVAVAREVPCVALFGPTCAQEIDLFDSGERIVTPIPCAPCYRRTCDVAPNCMDTIELERVVAAVDRWAGTRVGPASCAPAAAEART